MTLLERAAEAVREALADVIAFEEDGTLVLDGRIVAQDIATAALRVILTPTVHMANRGALKAFDGPQVEGEALRIYPAVIWREMLSYILEERDRERTDEAGAQGAGEGGREREGLRGDAEHGAGEPAGGAAAGLQGGEGGPQG